MEDEELVQTRPIFKHYDDLTGKTEDVMRLEDVFHLLDLKNQEAEEEKQRICKNIRDILYE